MLKCPRKLKLVDFAWYFVVLTRGFYLTALTTCIGLGRGGKCLHQRDTASGKWKNRGKLASCMSPKGDKNIAVPKKTKTRKRTESVGKEIQHVQQQQREGETEIVAYFGRLWDCQTVPDCQTDWHTSESCACPRDCGRFWVRIGGRTHLHTQLCQCVTDQK